MRLMVVDDESIVRLSLKYLLESANLDVSLYECGEEALDAFRAEPERFDAIVTDLAMPGLRGTDLASAIWSTHPEEPIVLLSGMLHEASVEAFAGAARGRVLSKPAELEEILRALKSLGLPIRFRGLAA